MWRSLCLSQSPLTRSQFVRILKNVVSGSLRWLSSQTHKQCNQFSASQYAMHLISCRHPFLFQIVGTGMKLTDFYNSKIVWETFPMVSDEIFTRQVSRSAAVTSMRSCLLQSKMMLRMDDRRRVLALPSSFALDLSDATIKLKFNLTRWSTKCCQLP